MAPSMPRTPTVVKGHVPGRGCGCDLVGRRVDGACPVCGFPVERSLGNDRLRFADPERVRRRRRGWRIVVGSIAAPLVAVIAALIARRRRTAGGL